MSSDVPTPEPPPRPAWAWPSRARELRTAPLPERLLGDDEAALVELALLGVPQAARALVDAVGPASGEPLALRDGEGVLRAVLEGDRLEGVDAAAHADAVDLRLDPRGPRDPATAGGGLALLVPGVLDPATLAAARAEAESRGLPLVVLLAPDGRGADTAAAVVRAARVQVAAGTASGVRLVRLPAPPGWADDAVLPLLTGAAAVVGAVAVAVPGSASGAVREAADAGGLAVVDGVPATDVEGRLRAGQPVDGLVPQAAEALRVVFPPPAQQGLCVFFTGLSGSGKSTVAQALVALLREAGGRRVTVLDGDVVRTHLSRGLTFSREDRDLNVERIGFVASVAVAHGGAAVCAPIAPFDAPRRRVRARVEAEGAFVLVHVATPLEVCEARDRKGLYAKARAGQIPTFTGISDPYEAPVDAEVVVDTSRLSALDAAQEVLAHLRSRGLVG